MRVFALTGGIASGKSTVSARWSTTIPVVDADLAAHSVLRSTVVKRSLVDLFGSEILVNDEIDRKILGKIVFSDAAARVKVEKIVHPRVRRAVSGVFDVLELSKHKLACYDVPLLFETGTDVEYSPIVVVNVDPAIQIQRLLDRNQHLTRDEAQARIDSQFPLVEKVQRADYVIDNNGSLSDLFEKADRLLVELRVKYT